MNGLIMGAMVALSMFQQTDTTFAVGTAERLNVETLGGSIRVDVWDEERIRVRAEHSTRTFVEIERGRTEIQLEAEARRGPANLVDFHVTVPRRFALELEAQYGDITIEGSDGAVEAETVQGDVTILGGRGTIQVSATIGSIRVEGAEGRIEIESSAADIHVVRSSGEIYAETAGGSVVLEDVSPTVVDVGSTGGRVHYDGTFEPGGTYFFGAHGGSLTIVVPEGASAEFNVATVHGSITSNLRGEAEALRGGERHQFVIGGGGALVEAETYGGRIRLLRQGTEGTEAPSIRRTPNRDGGAAWSFDRGEGLDHGWSPDHADHGWYGELGEGIGARIAAEVGARMQAEVQPRIQAQVQPRIRAEVQPRVQAEVQPWIQAQVQPIIQPVVQTAMQVAVTPRVEVRVQTAVARALELLSDAERRVAPATIRR
jgi:hypothetical protein